MRVRWEKKGVMTVFTAKDSSSLSYKRNFIEAGADILPLLSTIKKCNSSLWWRSSRFFQNI